MFALVLGLSWLVLTPLCVWMLFGRDRGGTARVIAALTLVGLQTGTVLIGIAEEHQEHGQATHIAARATPSPSAPPTPSPRARPCATRALSPSSVRLSRRETGLDGMTVYWAASPDECGTASVALHPDGRRLQIWLREGAAHHKGARILPVKVAGGLASLELRLSPPLRPRSQYVAVDARTGHRIPERRGA
ncbi:hypothetical protein Pth03_47420 [Planotetraspora thailandica]|uniref:Uncharacterized protein n=2 Tax=Planotetraspora thailandica TaxID=487172 RepID=A0A8J3V2P4_9ACTN|nr:hypothetical protein Pth03_47420 [Planotetraspora thailandica]